MDSYMTQSAELTDGVRIEVKNIGGISDTQLELAPGVNILAGRNATNRTSLLRSIMVALGSDDVSLKSDASEGFVSLEVNGETYTRRLVREDGRVKTEGEPYMEDAQPADLFAFLLATNETRQTVLGQRDLYELLMRPVDTEEIQREIETLTHEAREIDEEVDALSSRGERLRRLKDERAELADEIASTEAALEDVESELDAADTAIEEPREEEAEVEQRMSELGDLRSKLESARQELQAQRDSLGSLRDERDRLTGELEELPDVPASDLGDLDAEIDDRQERLQEIESDISTLQRIIQYNEENLEGASSDILNALSDRDDVGEGSVTDELVTDTESVVCWTCGHEVARDDIEATLSDLRDLQSTKLATKRSLEDELDDFETERIEYEERQRQREQVETQLERTRDQIATREDRIEELEETRDELTEQIDALERDIEDLQSQKNETLLEFHKEANELEVELNRLNAERETVAEKITQTEAVERREAIREELTELRTRIDRIETEAVDSFNEEMDTVLDALEYENLARIWIEWKETEVSRGRRTVAERELEMHIVRESEDGRAYEDTLDHLSESEREVTGLAFALAGYLAHDVYEKVPFMLLDSLEAIDSDRIAKLVDYFERYPDYLVAALLPEDAAATADEYPTIRNI
jgi:DNA repair exonuclease SbcCD ATPase subunit